LAPSATRTLSPFYAITIDTEEIKGLCTEGACGLDWVFAIERPGQELLFRIDFPDELVTLASVRFG
jgi:hypothetical protein